VKSLRWAAIISAVLTLVKGVAFVSTGSIAVLASFLDSLVDTLLSFVNFKVSVAAKERADRKHPYGHGGFEVLAAMAQGVLIAGSGVLILFQSIDRMFSPAGFENLMLEHLPAALAVMLFSTIAAAAISLILNKSKNAAAAQDSRSLSLNADHAHYSGDVLQNLVTFVGIACAWWWKTPWADVIAGITVGLILLKTAYPLVRDCARDIMNTEFDPKLRARVEQLIGNSGIIEVRGIHRLRTRTLGPSHFVDFHLKLPNLMPLIQAHEIADRIESLLKKEIPGVDVLVHLDPEAEPDDDFY
jgi:ferrous-iron efflux pump FieF